MERMSRDHQQVEIQIARWRWGVIVPSFILLFILPILDIGGIRGQSTSVLVTACDTLVTAL